MKSLNEISFLSFYSFQFTYKYIDMQFKQVKYILYMHIALKENPHYVIR